jgi:hypothetical protein
MLVIRQEQMNTLIKGTDDEWVDFLATNAKKEDYESVKRKDDSSLREMVRVAVGKAELYGFTAADDQSAFVAIMFEVAPNFDEQPEIKAVLTEHKLPPSQRLQKLWSTAVPEEAWEKAAEDYDENAWKETRLEQS